MPKHFYLTISFFGLLFFLVGQSVFAQNVGIGTATPQNKLDVRGWVRLGNESMGANPDAGSMRYHTAGFLEYHDGTAWQRITSGWVPAGNAGTNDATDFVGTTDAEDLSLRVNGVEAIRVETGTQHVGLFTDPNAALHLQMQGPGITDGFRIESSAGNNQDWYYYMDADDDLVIRDDNSDVMTFQNGTDNVGIGTGNPQARLHVVGPSTFCFRAFDGFEAGLGGWNNSAADDDDWTPNSGGTASGSTGPNAASEGTQYIYTESSGSAAGDVYLLERNVNLTGCPGGAITISYDYHMFFDGAADGGTLELIVDDGTPATEWSATGDQGAFWNSNTVDLSAYAGSNITLQFRFTTGTNTTFENDCALDNITINGPLTSAAFRLDDGNAQEGLVLTSFNANGDATWSNVNTLLEETTDNDWVIDRTGANPMIYNMQDRVGIGTDNPDHILHVYDETLGAAGTGIGIGSIEELIDESNETTINNRFSPANDNSYDLGSATLRWNDVYAANGTIQTSDAREKRDITPLSKGLSEVMALQPVTYKWKEERYRSTVVPVEERKTKIGFLAQDVEKVIGEVVYRYDWKPVSEEQEDVYQKVENERLGMNYGEMVPVLVNAIQEQQEQIEALKARVAELEKSQK